MAIAVAQPQQNSKGIILFAQVVSYIFHPVFIPLYVMYFVTYLHPTLLAGFSPEQRRMVLPITFLNLVFFPLLSVLLLKAVGFIESVYMRTTRDRIIPLIACGIFYFWGYSIFKNQIQYPRVVQAFTLGILFSSSAALMCNIYFKISLQAIGAGGLLGFFLVLLYSNQMQMIWPLALAIVIAGLVCTCRLLLGSHTQKEVYLGLLVGALSQFAAAYIVLG